MRRLVLLLLVIGGMVVPQAPAFACSCVDNSPREHYEFADVVFSGTATVGEPAGEPPPPNEPAPSQDVRWTFSVDGEQKGDAGDQEQVTTSGDSASCGYEFRTGNRYQVYAYRSDGGLWTSLCSGTHQLGAQEQPYQPQEASPSPSASPSPTATGPPSSSPSPSVAPTGAAAPSPSETPLPQTGTSGGTAALALTMLIIGALVLAPRVRRVR